MPALELRNLNLAHPTGRGAVAVIVRQQRFLIIRRSQHVRAPGAYCFPGGGIETGETEQQAVRREVVEELGVAVEPVRKLWHSVTPWNVELAWWLARLHPAAVLALREEEVESVHWLTVEQMRALPTLLESNHHFLDALQRGEFRLLDGP